jgi:hypothetical protein
VNPLAINHDVDREQTIAIRLSFKTDAVFRKRFARA